jgi:hypothetical protein
MTAETHQGGAWGATAAGYPGWMRVALRELGAVAVALAFFLFYAAFMTEGSTADVLFAAQIVAAACLVIGIAALVAPGRNRFNAVYRNL